MSTGDLFSMSDGDHKKVVRNRSREREQRTGFMDKARQFMDDTALGDGKKVLDKILGRVSAPAEDELPPPPAEEEYWDDEDEDDELNEAYDLSDPENVRVGYAKPGTQHTRKKSLDEAREESYDMRFGNLSGLLARFGAEGAEKEDATAKAAPLQIDKDRFRQWMESLYRQLDRQVGDRDLDWLHPDLLLLLGAHIPPEALQQWIIGGVFAATSENYLSASDQRWIGYLLSQANIESDEEALSDQIQQLFLFPERLHRLYQELGALKFQLDPAYLQRYRAVLGKQAIGLMAKQLAVSPGNLIPHLTHQWHALQTSLTSATTQVEKSRQQYAVFQERKMNSASVLGRLIQSEKEALSGYQKLQQQAQQIIQLQRLLHELQAEELLISLQTLSLKPFQPAQLTPLKLSELLDLGNESIELLSPPKPQTPPHLQADTHELSPLNQKRAVTQAKQGEPNALRMLAVYKQQSLHKLRLALGEIQPD